MPFIEANQKKLFVYHGDEIVGDAISASRLAVFAIHGLGSSHAFYAPLFARLAASGLRCFSHDTCGNGLSRLQSNDEAQSVASMALDASSVMNELGLDPATTVLVGHSMGGMVACSMASATKFAGLVLLGPVHPGPSTGEVFAKRIEVVKRDGMEAMADAIPKAATGSRATAVQRAWIRTLLLSQEPAGYVSLCRVIAEAEAPDYASITSPLLVIAGAEDRSAPLEGCKSILESCGTDASAKKLEVLDGVGHWHCVEAGDEIATSVLQFIAGL